MANKEFMRYYTLDLSLRSIMILGQGCRLLARCSRTAQVKFDESRVPI